MLETIIGGGAGLIQSGIGALTAKKQQERANRFNVDMWNRQNMYNSPAEQMKRLKEAGLNPNLVYGSSANTGNASPAPNFEKLAESGYTPVDLNSSIGNLQSFADLKIKKATADNIQTRTELAKQDKLLRLAQTAGRELENYKSERYKPYWGKLAEISTQALEAQLNKTKADTQFTLNQDERNAIMNSRNVIESIEKVIQMRTGNRLTEQQIRNLREDFNVKELESQLAKEGIRPQDDKYWKVLETALESIFGTGFMQNPDGDDIFGKGKKWLLDKIF